MIPSLLQQSLELLNKIPTNELNSEMYLIISKVLFQQAKENMDKGLFKESENLLLKFFFLIL